MKVALLHPSYWPEVRRGTERVLHDLAAGLAARGHRPRIIVSHPGRPRRSVEDGVPVWRHWRPPAGPLASKQRHLTHLPFAYMTLRAGRDDVAHAFYVTDALAAARWSAATGRPAIFSVMGLPEPGALRTDLQRRVWRRALGHATVVTVLSQAALSGLRRTFGDVEARVLPPGVDLTRFPLGQARAPRPTIFCPAVVDAPRKRVDLLVRAFATLRQEVRDARLWLSAPVSDAAAARMGLPAPGVEVLELERHGQLADAYGRAWITALPSRAEAFGLVLVESLACGTPIVGTDAGGIAEIVGDKGDVGRLFSGDDSDALARELRAALELTGRAGVRERCRRRAEHFSVDASVAAYERLYEEIST